MIAAMIKSAIVLAIAGGVASLLKRQSAAVRHAVWTAGLLGALAIPLCTLTLPSWQARVAGRALSVFQNVVGELGVVRQVAVVLWIAGAVAGLLLLFYSAARLAWVAMGAEPVDNARWNALAEEVRASLGIRRPVHLLQNRSVPFLGTWGIVVPRVLLPKDSESWPDDRIRMVLAHELAHIQRHDWVVQVLADAARAIYWFNPIFWMASSRLRRESEHACDDAVIRLGAAGTHYAEELVAMTRALRSERLQSPILAMAQPSHLEQRLVALLNPSLNRLAATPWAVILVAGAAVALTLPLAAVRSVEENAGVRGLAPGSEMLSIVQSNPLPTTADARGNVPPPAEPPRPARKLSSATMPVADSVTVAPTETTTPLPAEIPAEADSEHVKTSEIATLPAAPVQPRVDSATTPPFECKVTRGILETKTRTVEKMALGNGPWIINQDRTIWAADQPYIANRVVNTVWMRPSNTELKISARRLDGDAPQLTVGPAAPYRTGYIAVGVVFPAPGCWEVTATAGESTLTYITRVQE
jgi:beta-lactamase regulating signal transducer with metallopeptidase domain